MEIFEGRGYDGVGKGNFSMGNMVDMGNMADMAYGLGNIGNLDMRSLSNCSSASIFVNPHFREAAKKLRNQVRKQVSIEKIEKENQIWKSW